MPTPVPDVDAPFNPVRLHQLMGGFLIVLAGGYLCVTYLRGTPAAAPETPPIAYAPSAVGAVVMLIALLVLKRRAPARRSDQTTEQYWSMPQVRQGVPLFWFVLEGGAILTTVGYYLTGGWMPMILMGLAIVTFWLCGPDAFTKA
jgi:hypothetical protein